MRDNMREMTRMTQQGQQEESIGGLARRWLKTQLRFHGDPIKSRRDQQEAQALEQRMHDKAHDDASNAVVTTLMPESWKRKIASLERANEEGRIARDQQRRNEHEARMRVPFSLTLAGAVTGSVETEIPLLIHPPVEPGDALAIELVPLEPFEIGSRPFLGMHVAVPAFVGAGEYDLNALEERLQLTSWDPLWFQLSLDTFDDALFWTSEYGQGTVTVTDTSIRIQLPMSNGNGTDVLVDARIDIPPGVTS
ncbi:MAG: hypothetical protein M3439_09400 [Chloroflexota bacterium]|nr:hypothetical protein [Chloroflexota bacterium]